MKIQFLVYPGMTLLDLVGPAQIWVTWPDVEMQFVWKNVGEIPTDANLAVVATTNFAEAWQTPDILFVPGGEDGTFDLLGDKQVTSFLAARGERAGWVTSVCSGSLVLGAAGLLRGYRATSHWFVRDALALFGATPTAERWVIDRNRATGGGVTAGIDFGLALMARVAGEQFARSAQLQAEYTPDPPFRSGSPAEASAETLAAVRALWAGERAEAIAAKLQRAAQEFSNAVR
jgi:cyclohexyl-isocyanide hydratase